MWLLTITVLSFSMLGQPSVQSKTLIRTSQMQCENLSLYFTNINAGKDEPGTTHKTIAKCEKEQ